MSLNGFLNGFQGKIRSVSRVKSVRWILWEMQPIENAVCMNINNTNTQPNQPATSNINIMLSEMGDLEHYRKIHCSRRYAFVSWRRHTHTLTWYTKPQSKILCSSTTRKSRCSIEMYFMLIYICVYYVEHIWTTPKNFMRILSMGRVPKQRRRK